MAMTRVRRRILAAARCGGTAGGTTGGGEHGGGEPTRQAGDRDDRNLYLGADINRPVLAAVAALEPAARPAGASGAGQRDARDAGDRRPDELPVRSGCWRMRSRGHRADLIGLQEVALWRSGPLQLDPALVRQAQRHHGRLRLHSRSCSPISPNAVSSTPRSASHPRGQRGGAELHGHPAGDRRHRRVRLTMRDVVLIRVEDGLTATGEGQAVYAHNLAVTIAGATMNFDRGYQWVDVRAGSKRVRFINTRMEAFSSTQWSMEGKRQLTLKFKPPAGGRPMRCSYQAIPLAEEASVPLSGLRTRTPWIREGRCRWLPRDRSAAAWARALAA